MLSKTNCPDIPVIESSTSLSHDLSRSAQRCEARNNILTESDLSKKKVVEGKSRVPFSTENTSSQHKVLPAPSTPSTMLIRGQSIVLPDRYHSPSLLNTAQNHGQHSAQSNFHTSPSITGKTGPFIQGPLKLSLSLYKFNYN